MEADITGTGQWVTYARFTVEAGRVLELAFPTALPACWVRAVADRDATVTAMFRYE